MLIASPLLALVLSAHAGYVPRAVLLDLEPGYLDGSRVTVITPGDGTVAGVSAELVSDAGEETVVLTESDTRLHGAATLAALPTVDASLTLTLYDAGSASLMSFSGHLGADGSVSVSPDSAGEVCSRLGCEPVSTADVEVLAAEVFVNADGGYDVTFDLAGADASDVAYADIFVSEDTVTGQCSKYCGGNFRVEVGWETLGAVWQGYTTLLHEGLIEVRAQSDDVRGRKIEAFRTRLAAPWDDGGYGVSALATDDDPLTSVALVGGTAYCERGTYFGEDCSKLTVVSDGWTLGDTLPIDASVALDNGDTLMLPANSYQVAAVTPIDVRQVGGAVTLTLDGATATIKRGTLSQSSGGYTYLFWVQPTRSAVQGVFVSITEDVDGAQWLSVSAFAADPADVPAAVSVSLDGGRPYELTFDDEVAVVFAGGVEVSGDPIGIDLSGKVSLLGEANSRGRQQTLAKGKFYATLSRDADGDLGLVGADKDTLSAKGDILIGGEPIDFELTTNDRGAEVLSAPPAVMLRNGTGTRATASNTSQTQQAQLL